ncbi:ATP-binding protein [Nocardia suismassiliense]|uniref:ATP-binding protein n=1 Tax=Nocardia suismassiliense TaxID=2077092 RepID=UPI000D1D8AAB|nr:tetratricopeptide repeat protein [Nocardia suismassiliense]
MTSGDHDTGPSVGGPRDQSDTGFNRDRLVDARAAQGVQIGDHNTQVIYNYRRTRTDSVAPPPSIGVAGEPITAGLPPAPRTFVGRERELQRILDSAAQDERGVTIHAIDGMAGVGKTALAIRATHELASRFPDGRYFVELHAHTPGQTSVSPLDVLGRLLWRLGVDPHDVPDTLIERRDLWRHHTARKAALVVLDDAADRHQVEPLLPSGPRCLTLITSRHRLILPDMQPIAVEVLRPAAAAEMFLILAHRDPSHAGEREVAERIAAVCGYLPLAVGPVAGHIAHHPAWTVTDISQHAQQLAAAADRLAALDSPGDPRIQAAFELSYQALPTSRQLLFRRLGLHPGPELEVNAVAALADVDLVTARRELEALYTDHLIEETARGRYRFHDLLREFAHALAATDPAADNTGAIERLLNYYQHTATAENRWEPITPGADPDDGAAATAPESDGEGSAARPRALAWMRVELANLMACLDYCSDRDPARMVELTAAMAPLFMEDGPWPVAVQLHQRAAEAAHRLGDQLGEANALNNIGRMRWGTDDYEAAEELFQQALTLHRKIGNEFGEANSLADLGRVRWALNDHRPAAELLQQALALYRRTGSYRWTGSLVGAADALNLLGRILEANGGYETAETLYRQALSLYRKTGIRRGEAESLGALGGIRRATGDYEAADELLQQALALHRQIGNRHGEASTLNFLGQVRVDTGDYAAADELLAQTLALHRQIGNPHGEAEALVLLGHVRLSTGSFEAANEPAQQALTIHRQIGDRRSEAHTLHLLGFIRLGTHNYEAANGMFQEALTLYREIGNRVHEADSLSFLAQVRLNTRDYEAAVTLSERALAIYREVDNSLGETNTLSFLAHARSFISSNQ